jgi:hypothetical protein
MKQQLSIINTLLRTVNSTISDMEYNNCVINEGLSSLKSYRVRFTSETETQLNTTKCKCNRRGAHRVNNALDPMQRNLDFMTESVVNT